MSYTYTALIACEAITFKARDVDDAEVKYNAFFRNGICPEHNEGFYDCGCLVSESDEVSHTWETTYDGPITIEELN
jgi:hypothetical protein